MILVDTSQWIDHFRGANNLLPDLLTDGLVCIHPWIIGELACGHLKNRQQILALLQNLPQVTAISENEVLFFIEQYHLMGRGIGYIDAHLLAATAVNAKQLWTRDKRLQIIAESLGIAYLPKHH